MEAGKVYTLNVKYTIKDGELGFELEVDHSTEVIDDTIVFEPVSTGLAPSGIYEIWAGHATVHADVDEAEFSDPSAIKFAYRPQGNSGSLNIGNWLYAMLVLFGANVAYCLRVSSANRILVSLSWLRRTSRR